jgi:hypothetical protein
MVWLVIACQAAGRILTGVLVGEQFLEMVLVVQVS